MKKLLTFFLTALLAFGVGWATEVTYSYTFTSKQFTANNQTKTLNDVDWTLTGDGGYWGYDGTKGQQFGSGSSPYKTLNLTTTGIPGTVKSVTVNASTASGATASIFVRVDGTLYTPSGGNSPGGSVLSTSATNYTFTGSLSGTVLIYLSQTTSKALYIKSITIVYETGGGTTTVTAPTFSIGGSTVTGNQSANIGDVVTINADSGCEIYYTTDGSDPNNATSSGSNSVNVTLSSAGTTTIRAIAVDANLNISSESTITFTVVDPSATNIYKKVTSADDLIAGKKYIFLYENSSSSVGMGAISSNKGTGITGLNLSSNQVDINGKAVIEFTLGGTANAYTFEFPDGGGYLAKGSGNTDLTSSNDATANASKWTTVSDGGFYITNNSASTRGVIYNGSVFGTYATSNLSNSGYDAAYLYVQNTNDPTLSANTNSIDLGTITGGASSVSDTFTLTGANLTAGVNLSVTGDGFSVSPTTIADANGNNTITVTYNGNSPTTATGIITIESANDEVEDVTVTVTASRAQVATPTFSLADGTYNTAQSVTISCATTGATIYYTTDGSTPTTSSTQYTGAISVGSTTTIKAIAVASGYVDSEVATATYTINLIPVITASPATVNINDDNTSGAKTGSFTVTGRNLSDNIGVNVLAGSGNFSRTTSDQTWGFNFGTGSVDGTAYVTYEGKALGATGRVDARNNQTGDTVNVNYLYTGPIYIMGNVNSTGWATNNGVQMDRDAPTGNYSKTLTLLNSGDGYAYISFTKALANTASDWNAIAGDRFGPQSNGDWTFYEQYANQPCALDTTGGYYSIKMPAGEWVVSIDPANNKFTLVPHVSAPVFTPAGGRYDTAQSVEITCANGDAHIYYTTDGTTPSASNGTLYSGAIPVSSTTTIKAIAIYGNYSSEVTTETYTIKPIGADDFVLVTNTNDVTSNDDYVLVYDETNALSTSFSSGVYAPVSSGFSVADDVVTLDDPTTVNVLTLEDAGNNQWFIKDQNNYYIGNSSSTTLTRTTSTPTTDQYKWSISISSDLAVIQNASTSRYLQYNTSSPRFTTYGAPNSGSAQQYAALYKRGTTVARITVDPDELELVIPAGGSSQSGTATVTETNTTGTTSVSSITGTGASYFSAQVNNGTLTVTYNGTAAQATPDEATITLINGSATATVDVTGYKLPLTVTITPSDGHHFQGSTVTGMIESNVAGATLEYSFDGTTWQTYDANNGFTATVSTVGGTVTVYARATYNGETATAQATYTRIATATNCTADIVFAPTTNNGEMSQWSTFVTHIGEGADYLSSGTVSKIYTNTSYNAMRFGTGSALGEMTATLDLTKFTGGACKLTKVTINAARYSNDTDCALNVSTNVNTTGVTQSVTAGQDDFADYVFTFNGSEITTLTIANTTVGKRVYVHSISLEYNCGAVVAAPEIEPETGTYYENKTVEIAAETGATIYYTTDGSDPATSNTRIEYTNPFTVNYDAGTTTTIIAIAEITENGETMTSDPTTVVYTWGVPVATIDPATGNVTTASVNVSITPTPAEATVYYTTDGSTPDTGSELYEGPFDVILPKVGDAVTVKAIAVYNGLTSEVEVATYTRVIEVVKPFFSPIENYTYYGDQQIEILCTTENADIYYEIVSVSGANPPDASQVPEPTKSSNHYNGTISMTVGNSYYVKAIAYIGDFASEVAQGWFTIKNTSEWTTPTSSNVTVVLENVAQMRTVEAGSRVTFRNPIQVVYMSSMANDSTPGSYTHPAPEYVYVRDNSGYGVIYFGKGATEWATTTTNRRNSPATMFKMGDWIAGNEIEGTTGTWESGLIPQVGTKQHTIYSWPASRLGNTPVIAEEVTCADVQSGTVDSNLCGHYLHLRKTTMSDVMDYQEFNTNETNDRRHIGTISDADGECTYYDRFWLYSGTVEDNYTYPYPTSTPVTYTLSGLGHYDQQWFDDKGANATFDIFCVGDYYSGMANPYEVYPLDFLWIFKPVISLPSGEYSSEQTVTLTVEQPSWTNDPVVIYYKTDDMEDWAIYTQPIPVNSDTHLQAYAQVPTEKFNDIVRSVTVEATYEFVGIEDPIITSVPDENVILVQTGNESVTVTIETNPQSDPNTVTLYTTNGEVPTLENGTVVANGQVTLDPITETTTVTAISYLMVSDGQGGTTILWSNPVTETYTFVKSNGVVYDLVHAVQTGMVYVIVNKEANMGLSTTQNATNRASTGVMFTDNTQEHVYGNDELALFVLESANAGRYYFKNVNGGGYLTVTTNDYANLNTSAATSTYSQAAVAFGTQADGYPATITFNYDGTNRYLRYFENGRTFTTNSDATLNKDVFLYGTQATPLAYIESEITAGSDVQVTVADDLIGAWAVNGNGKKYLWAKDFNYSIDKTTPVSGQKDYMMDVLHYQNNPWDQSNWVIIDFVNSNANPEDLVGKKLAGGTITGKYVDGQNYRIVLESVISASEDVDAVNYPGYGADPMTDDPEDYELGYNTYSPANFLDANLNAPYGEGFTAGDAAAASHVGEKLFFMNPKVQEVVRVWAVYAGNDLFTVYQTNQTEINGFALEGAFNVNWTYNRLTAEGLYGKPEESIMEGIIDEPILFHAVIEKKSGNKLTTPQGQADPTPSLSERYVVNPLDIQQNPEGNITAVKELKGNKEVESVRFYNIMGQESKAPFEGVNIVVTRYTDGSTSTTKILR